MLTSISVTAVPLQCLEEVDRGNKMAAGFKRCRDGQSGAGKGRSTGQQSTESKQENQEERVQNIGIIRFRHAVGERQCCAAVLVSICLLLLLPLLFLWRRLGLPVL